MKLNIRKISCWLVVLCFAEICYGKDASTDSIVSTLSTMDLNNVKAENEKKIGSIISRLSDYQNDKKKLDAEQKITTNSPLKVDSANGVPNTALIPTDKSNGKQVDGESLVKTEDKGVDETTSTDESNSKLTPQEMRGKIYSLDKKVSLIMNELDALVELQKIAYENESIAMEMAKNVSVNNNKTSKVDDYLATYSKQKKVKTDPTGFAYNIIKAGAGKIIPDNLIRITLEEKTTTGKRLSYVNDATLKYNSTLPQIIYRALQYIGYGGEIKIVAQAKKNYTNGSFPVGVGANTPLIYVLSVKSTN